jgi:TonB-dependent SusC/RagA subfamily outer membrane receptor
MPEAVQYFLKLSVSLAAVYLFYWFILRKLTFYNWNRWYLLIYSLLCFYIPFVDISPVLEKNELADSTVIGFIPVVGRYAARDKGFFAGFDSWDWVSLFFYIGVGFMFIRLILQYVSYYRLRKSAKLLSEKPVKLYQVDKDIVPFSFGNSIFINQRQHSEPELKEIIHHEFIHVKQQHSIDVLLSEIVCLLNWYNPFAWMMRKAIRQNLEFIADHQVLSRGLDRKQYQYLLLKVVGVSSFSVGNQFNFSSLKKRIMMMNKIRTARIHLIKFLFILPLIAVLLLSFRKNIHELITTGDKENDPSFSAGRPGDNTNAALNGVNKDLVQSDTNDAASANIYLMDTLVTLRGKELSPDMLIAVNGSIKDRSVLEMIMPSTVRDISVLRGSRAAQFGEEGVQKGVLNISTGLKIPGRQDTVPSLQKNATIRINNVALTADTIIDASLEGPSRPHNVTVRGYASPRQDILYVLDGEIQSSYSFMNSLSPDDIQEITILKDQHAVKKYGARAVNGVMEITTKEGLQQNKKKIKGVVVDPDDFKGLYILDGKEYDRVQFEELNLDPASIESIHVWKDASAVRMFGQKGVNGIIDIKTKNGAAATGQDSQSTLSAPERERLLTEAAQQNILYVNAGNPVKLSVEGVPAKDLVVMMQKASIEQKNGIFYIRPTEKSETGELKVYKKKSNGDLQLLQTHYFRILDMP